MSFGIVYMLIAVLGTGFDEMRVNDINLKSCRQNQGRLSKLNLQRVTTTGSVNSSVAVTKNNR